MATAASPHAPQAPVEPSSPKLLLPAVLLCFFLGTLGIHRFYVGKIGTGVLMIVTLGGLGVWCWSTSSCCSSARSATSRA